MLFIPLNVNWYRMPFSRAVDLDPHESTFIFPPPFHFMTCLNVEFYGEKDECVKVASILKINIKKLEVFFDYCLIIVFSSFKPFGSGSRNKVCLSNYIVFLQAQCPS